MSNQNNDYISILTNSGFFSQTDAQRFSENFEEMAILSDNESSHCIVLKVKQYGKWHIIKRLKPEYAKDQFYIQLLEKEFDIGYHLDHSNIARVIGKNYDENGLFTISEYVDGDTLRDRMDDPSFKHDLILIDKISKQVNKALSYIHNKQIVHRDLKPENIMITHNGNNVKIIDFGLSDTDYHYLFKGAAGTRKYAAPEQLADKPSSSHKTDYYSFGLILLEMLTGNTIIDDLKSIKHPFKRIISGCIIKDANKRFGYEQVDKLLYPKSKHLYIWAASAITFAIISIFLFIQSSNFLNMNRNKPQDPTKRETDNSLPSNKGELTVEQLITESYDIGYLWIDSLLNHIPDFNAIDDPYTINMWHNTYAMNSPYHWVRFIKKHNITPDITIQAEQSFLDGIRKADSIYFNKVLNSKHYTLAMGSESFYQLDMANKVQRLLTYHNMIYKGIILVQDGDHVTYTENTIKMNDYFNEYISVSEE